MVDYHVHPNFSQDAEGSIADYCRQARAVGLEEICFTPHIEIDPVRKALDDKVVLQGRIVSMHSDWLDYYYSEIEQARSQWSPLEVRFGIEVGYDPSIEDDLRRFIDSRPFDYVIGSIHCIDHVSITSHSPGDFYYAGATAQVATEGYFSLLQGAIESRLFNAIGHIDVFKKYGPEKFGAQLTEMAIPYWPDVFRRIVECSPLTIEINTSGYRRGPGETYPAESVLKVAREAGLEYVALGSDAHRVQDLASRLEDGVNLANRLGFRIARYRERKLVLSD